MFFSFAGTVIPSNLFVLSFVNWFKMRNTYLFHINSFLPIFFTLFQLYHFALFPIFEYNHSEFIHLFKAFIFNYQASFLHFRVLPALLKAIHQIMNWSPSVPFQFVPILFYIFLFLTLKRQLFISNFLALLQSIHCKLDASTIYFFIQKNLWF